MTERQIRTLVKGYWKQVEVSKYKVISLEEWLRKIDLTEAEIKYALTVEVLK